MISWTKTSGEGARCQALPSHASMLARNRWLCILGEQEPFHATHIGNASNSTPQGALLLLQHRAGYNAPRRTSSSVFPSMSLAMSLSASRPYFSQARTKALKSRLFQPLNPAASSSSFSAASACGRRRERAPGSANSLKTYSIYSALNKKSGRSSRWPQSAGGSAVRDKLTAVERTQLTVSCGSQGSKQTAVRGAAPGPSGDPKLVPLTQGTQHCVYHGVRVHPWPQGAPR